MDRRLRKWVVLGVAGLAGGLLTLWLLRSIPMAAGTTVFIMAAVVILKHLALAVAIGSPLAAFFQGGRAKIREHCPFKP
jgi:hypothetical protein